MAQCPSDQTIGLSWNGCDIVQLLRYDMLMDAGEFDVPMAGDHLPNLNISLTQIDWNCQQNKMFYVSSRSILKVSDQVVIDCLRILPLERTSKHHQAIYHYFINNQLLNQLERVKSLNAKIKCVAALQIIQPEHFDSETQIIIHTFQNLQNVVLSREIKYQAEKFDERIMRNRMEQLTQFSITKLLKYNELLFLAYNMQYDTIKSKSYLYQENDEPEYVYFIVDGQFHYLKKNDATFKERKTKRKTKTIERHSLELKNVSVDEQNPNRIKKSQVQELKIGIVEGQLGQYVGLEELVLDNYRKNRKYSVVCMSAEAKYIKIHKRYFEILFNEFPEYHELIQEQIKSKDAAKNRMVQRINETKKHMQEYLKENGKNTKLNECKQVEDRQSNKKAQRYIVPKIQTKSSISYEYRSKAFSSILNASLQGEDKHVKQIQNKSLSNEQKEEEEDGENSFGLTSIPIETRHKFGLKKQKSSSSMLESKKTIELPKINEMKQEYVQKNQKKLLPPIGNKFKIKANQYGGLIDSSSLIRQKQEIMSRKITRKTREHLFPTGYLPLKQIKKEVSDKWKISSPAHSNRFMEQLLLKALKKSGYDSEKPASTTISIEHAHQFEKKTIHLQRAVQSEMSNYGKIKRRQSVRPKQADLLMKSAFDECYFNVFP